MAAREGWKTTGLLKGLGIPAPTGQYVVGCVDLMHKLEGDNDGLLVRLFYPTNPQLREGGGYQYAKWTPHKRYTKGFLDFNQIKLPGLLSSITNLVIDPHMPAFYGAPLFEAASTDTGDEKESPKSQSGDQTPGGKVEETEEATSTTADGGNPAPQVDQNNEQPSPKEIRFPVIVFSHGLGAMRTVYSAICTDLASHGYVIAAVEHRDRSAALTMKRVPKPGGQDGELMDEWLEFYHRPESEPEFPLRNKQVKQRASEVRQGLDLLQLLNDGGDIQNMLEGGKNFDYGQFKGRLDVDTVAVMGHSFGGATTVQVLSEDSRFLCGIGLDTWMYPVGRELLNGEGIQQPLIFINSYDFQWKENIKQMMQLTSAPDETGRAKRSLLTLKDSNHYNQTDVLFILPVRGKRMSRIPPYQAHQLNQELCLAFLKRYLLKDPSHQRRIPDLDGGEGCSEFIIHGTNVDITDPPAKAEQQEERAETEVEETPKEEAKREGESVEEGENDGTEKESESETGQEPARGEDKSEGEVTSEKEKSENDTAAALDPDTSDTGLPKL